MVGARVVELVDELVVGARVVELVDELVVGARVVELVEELVVGARVVELVEELVVGARVVEELVVGSPVVDDVGSPVVELVVDVFPSGDGKFMKFVAMPRVIPCPLERPDPIEFATS